MRSSDFDYQVANSNTGLGMADTTWVESRTGWYGSGTTEWDMGYDDRPSESGRKNILDGASSFAPVIRSGEIVKHTACLRPVTDDGLPIVGPLDARPRDFGRWRARVKRAFC